ncbi:MAG: acetoacetate decarboxylase family protein [Nocardioidaceae bacterium]
MGARGTLAPTDWGYFMPAHNSPSGGPPYYYQDSERITITYRLADIDAALAQLPSELELADSATGFLVVDTNPRTTLGQYAEVYNGIHCTYAGKEYGYVPGCYEDAENSQLVGREIWGFGKKRAHRIALWRDNAKLLAEMDIFENDGAVRLQVLLGNRVETDLSNKMPVMCLRIVPNAEDTGIPALAQLVEVDSTAEIIKGSDGGDEAYTGRLLSLRYNTAHDCDVPVGEILDVRYTRYNMILSFGKVLKTYTEAELRGQVD